MVERSISLPLIGLLGGVVIFIVLLILVPLAGALATTNQDAAVRLLESDGFTVSAEGDPVLIPDGSEGSPGLAFIDELSTGLYRDSSGHVNVTRENSTILNLRDSAVVPGVTDAIDLGTGARRWDDINLNGDIHADSGLQISALVGNIELSPSNGEIRPEGRVRFRQLNDSVPFLVQQNVGYNVAAEHYGDSRARFSVRRAEGTIANPTAVTQHQHLGSYQGWGYDGGGMEFGGEINFIADETWDGTSHGTRVRFDIAPPGQTALEQFAELREPGTDETALLLRVDKGGSVSLERVSVGAADSGGTGFRVLRVPN